MNEELAISAAEVTPARLFTGRAGTSYRTAAALRLRADHAAARDAVLRDLDVAPAALQRLSGGRPVTVVGTRATDRQDYLHRPDLGRSLADTARTTLEGLCHGADLQPVLGDGLSARALEEQGPPLLQALLDGAADRGWSVGDTVVVTGCRVGVLNDIGDLLQPTVVVLLIGERPGLATASSLSAYLAYRPRSGDTDAHRNLVANVHGRGLSTGAAAERILALAETMRRSRSSGFTLKESPLGSVLGPSPDA